MRGRTPPWCNGQHASLSSSRSGVQLPLGVFGLVWAERLLRDAGPDPGPLAQLAEREAFNLEVLGSSPRRPISDRPIDFGRRSWSDRVVLRGLQPTLLALRRAARRRARRRRRPRACRTRRSRSSRSTSSPTAARSAAPRRRSSTSRRRCASTRARASTSSLRPSCSARAASRSSSTGSPARARRCRRPSRRSRAIRRAATSAASASPSATTRAPAARRAASARPRCSASAATRTASPCSRSSAARRTASRRSPSCSTPAPGGARLRPRARRDRVRAGGERVRVDATLASPRIAVGVTTSRAGRGDDRRLARRRRTASSRCTPSSTGCPIAVSVAYTEDAAGRERRLRRGRADRVDPRALRAALGGGCARSRAAIADLPGSLRFALTARRRPATFTASAPDRPGRRGRGER